MKVWIVFVKGELVAVCLDDAVARDYVEARHPGALPDEVRIESKSLVMRVDKEPAWMR